MVLRGVLQLRLLQMYNQYGSFVRLGVEVLATPNAAALIGSETFLDLCGGFFFCWTTFGTAGGPDVRPLFAAFEAAVERQRHDIQGVLGDDASEREFFLLFASMEVAKRYCHFDVPVGTLSRLVDLLGQP